MAATSAPSSSIGYRNRCSPNMRPNAAKTRWAKQLLVRRRTGILRRLVERRNGRDVARLSETVCDEDWEVIPTPANVLDI